MFTESGDNSKEKTLHNYHKKQRDVIRDLLELLWTSLPHGLQKKHFYGIHSKDSVNKNVEECLKNSWMRRANDRFEITGKGIAQLGDLEREFVFVEMSIESQPIMSQESGVVGVILAKGVIGEKLIRGEVPPEKREKEIRKWVHGDFFPTIRQSVQRLRDRGVPVEGIKYIGVSK